MGGILLVISAAVIIVVTALLFNDIDNTLDAAHKVILSKIKVNELGRIETDLNPTDISPRVYMQVWGLDGELQASFRALENFAEKPFDAEALGTGGTVYRDTRENGLHLRVLTVPLQQRGHLIAILQVASSLNVVDTARDNLTDILSIIWVVAVLFSGIVVWFTLGQTLKPLGAITETVEQINRADDLSRRIPYQGPEDDEIGNLVGSFNQSLERLEALFTYSSGWWAVAAGTSRIRQAGAQHETRRIGPAPDRGFSGNEHPGGKQGSLAAE
jgi:HAMP domain-containing protein